MDLGSIEDLVNVMHGVIGSIDSGTAGRRERIATAALQGLLADPKMDETISTLTALAVRYADALIRALDNDV